MALACLQSAIAANIAVPAGANLQNALNSAHGGDTVTLQSGATYTGNFYLPANYSGQWITIQSSAMSSLPGGGSRVSSGNAASMPKLVTPNSGAALGMTTGANFYRIQGIEFTPAAGIYVQDLIQVGNGGERSVDALPHDIEFDRDYIHGEATNGGKRGIAMNGVNVNVENCYISGFFSTWQDTQAIAGWNGPGPFKILNNYLEASTETVAFGGAVPSIGGLIPSDILIQNNTFFKPLSWKPGSPSFAGVSMWVKNHFELKSAQRVTLDSNTFENNWVGADQRGFALVFTVRTEYNNVPWATVSDIKVTNNLFRHSAAGINLVGHDDNPVSGTSAGFLIQNNTFEDISGDWGGDGRLFQVLSGIRDVTIDHNNFFQTGLLMVFDGGPSYNMNFTNNIANIGWGIAGNGAGVGSSAWNAYVQGGTLSGNVLIGASSGQYPAGNFFPGSLAEIGFANGRLPANSPYQGIGAPGSNPAPSTSAPAAPAPAAPAPAAPAPAAPAPVAPTDPSGIPTGWVNVVSKLSGKCLDVSGISYNPGARMQQWGCWGGENQKFQFTPVPGGYTITAKHSNMQLDVAGGPGVVWDSVPIIQYPFWGGSNEVFNLQPTGDGSFNIVASHSGKCFDVVNLSTQDGAKIQQYGCWGGENQKWSFVPAQ